MAGLDAPERSSLRMRPPRPEPCTSAAEMPFSSFNNAGFALYSDSLMGFATDPLILLPISLAIIIGGRRRVGRFLQQSQHFGVPGDRVFLVQNALFQNHVVDAGLAREWLAVQKIALLNGAVRARVSIMSVSCAGLDVGWGLGG